MAPPQGKSADAVPVAVEAFIARWQGRDGGQERANYAMFQRERMRHERAPRMGGGGGPRSARRARRVVGAILPARLRRLDQMAKLWMRN